MINSTALKQDFDILRKTLEEAHPGLYWYTDSVVMDKFFDSTKLLLNRDMTEMEFFKFLLPVIANIKCGHTNLKPSHNEAAFQFTRILPFDLFCQGEKLYIRKDFTNKGYEGVEVLAINNIETKKIIQTLLNSIPSDGYNQTFKYNLLTKGAFREGYALYYGQPEKFTIQAIDNTKSKSYTFTVTAISQKEISTVKTNPPPPFDLRFQQNIAILSINTFEMNTRQFSDSISSIFRKIKEKNSQHLIMDLRENGGGRNDNVSLLYSFIAVRPFRHLKSAEMKTGSLTYTYFITNASSTNNSTVNKSENKFRLVNDRYAGTQTKSPAVDNGFKGNIILLTSGTTCSAASEFVAIAHFQKRVEIVGEETGGCYYGATGGNYLNLKLPNSGLEVTIPTIRILTAVDEDFSRQPKGRGTIPDYQISLNLKDIISLKDRQLDKAVETFKNYNYSQH
ncbi:S41 family peptidase [Nibrella viscosa]|uniref:S41 family peptidase n=1 Tax=Nibrella viscosa TaxID=1084524 RepID=A0ABP8KZU6_9BACT